MIAIQGSPMDMIHEQAELKKCLTVWDLIFLGIGALIGAGIFILTGIVAATEAGPALIISFILAGFACSFTALSYAELAASIGGSGSAYTYAFIAFGLFPAWIIGWDLILEYTLSVSTVAVGWSHYFNNILQALGFSLPKNLLLSPLEGGRINLPAMLIVFVLTLTLSIGVKFSARFNMLIVLIKLGVIGLFIIVAGMHLQIQNWHPFFPFGWQGVVSGAALIFFAYIGFDAISTSVEEVLKPQKNLPIGILVSLITCTILYIVVAALLTGSIPYQHLNVGSPISYALLTLGYPTIAKIIALGALAGLTTVMLVMYYGLTRIFFSISRDQLLPSFFYHINSRTKTPIRIILFSGLIMGLLSGFLPIHLLAEMVNIGTLTAFVIVCLGVIILRYQKPDLHRPFKTPFNPIIPACGALSCFYLMINLSWATWLRFFIWMICGLIIYFFYGRKKVSMKNPPSGF